MIFISIDGKKFSLRSRVALAEKKFREEVRITAKSRIKCYISINTCL